MNPIEVLITKPTVLVIGGGITGKSVVEFLTKFECKILLVDYKPQPSIAGISYYPDSTEFSDLGKIDFAVKSPGFKPNHPILLELRKNSIPVVSEIELARHFFKGKIIGITGTDGKSTTTALTYHIIQKSFPKSKMGGNIGVPFIEFCLEDLDIAVLELSSYQLDDSSLLDLDVSAVLNIAPDHLERHKTMENYLEAKKRIINRNNPNSVFVTNERLFPKLNLTQLDLKGKLQLFGETSDSSAKILLEEGKIITDRFTYSTNEFPLEGKHNLENLSASILLSEAIGCLPENIQSAISDFTGLLYRFQKIKTWNKITFINDSKSTNIHSMLSGLSGIESHTPIILILGGKQKDEELLPLTNRLKELNVVVFLIGEARLHWEKELRDCLNERLFVKENLTEAVKSIREKVNQSKFDMILFSPACASFDQYNNFEERGRHFTELVNSFFV
ncbi:MAG: UDP-N-acetylmuramoyl-L-alanine--D-glutamate ligase [Leptospiraceae bacterium]|nr:UDP-N-acetylmuramoyl-L-alanine--D-glutamate ligase [Leptospiraceae bacterium]